MRELEFTFMSLDSSYIAVNILLWLYNVVCHKATGHSSSLLLLPPDMWWTLNHSSKHDWLCSQTNETEEPSKEAEYDLRQEVKVEQGIGLVGFSFNGLFFRTIYVGFCLYISAYDFGRKFVERTQTDGHERSCLLLN